MLSGKPGRNRTADLYERGILVKRTTAMEYMKYEHYNDRGSHKYEESEGLAKECCRSGPCSYEERDEVAGWPGHSYSTMIHKVCEFSFR